MTAKPGDRFRRTEAGVGHTNRRLGFTGTVKSVMPSGIYDCDGIYHNFSNVSFATTEEKLKEVNDKITALNLERADLLAQQRRELHEAKLAKYATPGTRLTHHRNGLDYEVVVHSGNEFALRLVADGSLYVKEDDFVFENFGVKTDEVC